MAGNIILLPGGGGATLGTDLVGAVNYEIIKLGFSAAGVAPVQVAPTNPFPVQLGDGVNTPAIKPASTAPLATDAALVVTISPNSPSAGNPAAGATGAAVPASADYLGINVGGNLVGVSAANPLPVTLPGAITANQGGAPWTQNVIQVAGISLGATAIVNFGTAPAAVAVPAVNASLFSGTTSLTNTGSALDVNLKTSSITLPVSGTVTTTPPANASTNLTQWAGSVLGAPTNFGTTPTAVLAGSVNASLFSGTVSVTNTGGALDVNLKTSSITLPISGTVTANIGTTNGLALDTSVNGLLVAQAAAVGTQPGPLVQANVSSTTPAYTNSTINPLSITTQGFLRVIVQGLSNSGAASSGNPVTIAGTFNTSQPTVTTGQTVTWQMTARGSGIVIPGDGTNTVAVKAASTAAAAADPALVVAVSPNNTLPINLTQIAATTLGVPTNFGTTPGAVVAASVNASLFVGTTVAVAASAGVQKVGVAGATGATMDAVITAATAPANGLAVLVENVTTAPSLTTGQSVMAQADYQGSLFVKPYRRGQTVATATTISATGATAIVAAQAAGIFADISSIVITTAGLAAQTITISDGTLSWIIDYPNAAVAPGTPFVINFDPPLKATTAATAWTANQSLTTTCHYLVNVVLQKAS